MMKRNTESGSIVFWALLWLVLAAVSVLVGGLMIEYVVEFWASYAKKTPVDVPYFPCAIAGLFVGWNLAIPATIVTWILSFVL